jgi:hypothetical protein
MEYEDFLARPDAHLRELTGFLAFDQPLQPNYPKQKWTARLSLGDVSENIKTQRIQTGVQREVLAMSDALQAELESVHQQTAKELRRLCGWKL